MSVWGVTYTLMYFSSYIYPLLSFLSKFPTTKIDELSYQQLHHIHEEVVIITSGKDNEGNKFGSVNISDWLNGALQKMHISNRIELDQIIMVSDFRLDKIIFLITHFSRPKISTIVCSMCTINLYLLCSKPLCRQLLKIIKYMYTNIFNSC